ncbi:hypothetical protein [Pseudomonas lactis]|nr:hypothetical protein [Pseudomonas lactis]
MNNAEFANSASVVEMLAVQSLWFVGYYLSNLCLAFVSDEQN